jgi:hypothetical protein
MVDQAWKRGWQPDELVRQARRNLSAGDVGWCVTHRGRTWRATPLSPSILVGLWDSWRTTTYGVVVRALPCWRLGRTPHSPPVRNLSALCCGHHFPRRPRGRWRFLVRCRAGTAAAAGRGCAREDGTTVLARVRSCWPRPSPPRSRPRRTPSHAGAQALMARSQHRPAMLAALIRTNRSRPRTRRIVVDAPYEGPKAMLLGAVAEANRVAAACGIRTSGCPGGGVRRGPGTLWRCCSPRCWSRPPRR